MLGKRKAAMLAGGLLRGGSRSDRPRRRISADGCRAAIIARSLGAAPAYVNGVPVVLRLWRLLSAAARADALGTPLAAGQSVLLSTPPRRMAPRPGSPPGFRLTPLPFMQISPN